MLLLDDILSALDMHTALAVVNNCFAGNLLRGRTVILVTHNLSLVGKHARNFVHIASDGKISTNESLTESLTLNPDLVPELVEEKEVIKKAEELIDDSKAKPVAPQKSTGKLVVAEEIALGRVTLRARKYHTFARTHRCSLTVQFFCSSPIWVECGIGVYSGALALPTNL